MYISTPTTTHAGDDGKTRFAARLSNLLTNNHTPPSRSRRRVARQTKRDRVGLRRHRGSAPAMAMRTMIISLIIQKRSETLAVVAAATPKVNATTASRRTRSGRPPCAKARARSIKGVERKRKEVMMEEENMKGRGRGERRRRSEEARVRSARRPWWPLHRNVFRN